MITLSSEYEWNGGQSVLALGMFDGVHIGHASLLHKAKCMAVKLGLPSLVCTFAQHPLAVLHPERAPLALTTNADRERYIAKMGIDALILREFNAEIAQIEYDDYIKRLCDVLHPRVIVIGFNHTFGKNGCGTPEKLKELGQQLGFETHIVGAVTLDGEPVSSSAIRREILLGNMEKASRLLGRQYSVSGTVENGKQIGRKLGFPTANMNLPQGLILPPFGVYIAEVLINDLEYDAVLNIGKHPTLPDGQPTIEVFMLNFSGDLYGQELRVSFLSQIRQEMKFSSTDALKAQIACDVCVATEYFMNKTAI